jgi:hypothetical protein
MIRKFAFLHVPKAAGTSFTDALAAAHSTSPSIDANDRVSGDLAKDLDRFDIITGHLSYEDYRQWFSERAAFTVLRNPVERCLSWYWYCRNVVPASVCAPEVASARDLDPVGYFSQNRSIIYRVSINGQSRQLGGHINFPEADDREVTKRAMESLQKMVWIGFVETIDADLDRLRQLPEFANLPSLEKINTAPRDYEASPIVRRLIEENNQGDIELYEFARTLL